MHFPESMDALIVICGLLEPFRPEETDRSVAAAGDEDKTPVEFPRDFLSELREELPDGGFVCRAIR